MNIIRKNFFQYLQYSITTISISLFLLGNLYTNLNLLLIGLFMLWTGNIIYSFLKIKERIIFFLLNCAFLFFLFGRNLVELIEGVSWNSRFSNETNQLTLNLIFVSLGFLLCGAFVAGFIPVKNKEYTKKTFEKRKEEQRVLQMISLIVFFVCFFCLFATELDKLIFMRGKEYYQFYAEYTSNLPQVYVSLGSLTKYIMCLYLSTLPSKHMSILVLGLNVLSTVPMFLIGQRNPLISAGLLAIVYYVIRDYLETDKRKWFGKFEKTVLLLTLPFGLMFLSLYEQIRYNQAIGNVNVINSIFNLFRSQGVTYDIIANGIDQIPNLPDTNINYTFGPWINYLKDNFISSFLFGSEPIRSQTLESALYGNQFADTLSYLVLGNRYLEGAGLGSSCVIEPYIDFGWLGVIIFNALLGFFTIISIRFFARNIIFSNIALNSFLNFFMLPRSRALSWTVFLFYIPLYFIIFIIVIAVKLLVRYFENGKITFRRAV